MGFNMSWIFVDGIDQDALYAALDLVPTGGTPDQYDLGTSRVPWAGPPSSPAGARSSRSIRW
jgi:hypothetical protein